MSASVTTAGPYYSSGEIKFSSLRTNFKEASSGSIKASELRRNTTTTDTNPIVPDCTENRTSGPLGNGIATLNDLKISQFRNSIKYYYITQTGTDTNFDIDSQSWNSNLTRNIRKWMYINGTCGTNSISSTAADFNATTYNLTIDVSGGIYGCGGRGGGTGGGAPDPSGESGGPALGVASSGGNNIVVFVRSTANIYGGGGGGERGATGSTGSSGTCSDSYTAENCGGCPGCASGYTEGGCWSGGGCDRRQECNWWGNCWWTTSRWTHYRTCTRTYTVSGGTGGQGGAGGPGRGYNNQSGSLDGSSGSPGAGGNGCGSTSGGNGENGGSGGEWGNDGGSTSNSGSGGSSGKAITGSNYSVTGTINSSTVRGSYNP